MKCHLCSAWIEIKTDPENTRYVIVEGAKKQSDEWDTTDKGVVQPKGIWLYGFYLSVDVQEKKNMDDPFFKLEKDEEDKTRASGQHKVISELYDLSHRQWSDPWSVNSKLRKTFREEKKVIKAKATLAEDIRTRNGLHIDLLPESEEDNILAKMVDYKGNSGREADLRRRELKTSSILGKRSRSADDKRSRLERIVKLNTLERSDPFLKGNGGLRQPSLEGVVKVVKKGSPSPNIRKVSGFVSGEKRSR